jgi:hypothetical protein
LQDYSRAGLWPIRSVLRHFCSLTDTDACYEVRNQSIETVVFFSERPRSSVDRAAAF